MPGAQAEFARGWRTVLGASLGVGLGIAGLLTYNLGLFTVALGGAFGLSPATYGMALLALNVALALAVPVVGRLVDRFGPRAVASLGAIFLAAGFVALSLIGSVTAYVAALVLIGGFASLSAPVAHTRAVAGAFTRARGLALGITQVGIGLAAALVPPVIAGVIAAQGWQAGFRALALLALAGVVPVMFGLPGKGQATERRADQAAFQAVKQSRAFWLQLAAFTTMAFAFIGIVAHFVPMLQGAGLALPQAGALAGAIGMSVIVTRIVVGWLADRIEPAWLGAGSCALCAAGALALALGGPAQAMLAALALGCAIGAEADLIGIMTARNFPLAAYNRAYSIQYATFTLAAGASPLAVGVMAEGTGGYRVPLIVAACLLLVPIALFAMLARYQAVEASADNS